MQLASNAVFRISSNVIFGQTGSIARKRRWCGLDAVSVGVHVGNEARPLAHRTAGGAARRLRPVVCRVLVRPEEEGALVVDAGDQVDVSDEPLKVLGNLRGQAARIWSSCLSSSTRGTL